MKQDTGETNQEINSVSKTEIKMTDCILLEWEKGSE